VVATVSRAEEAIARTHAVTVAAGPERTAILLTGTMGFRTVGQEQNRFRYEVDHGGASRTVDVSLGLTTWPTPGTGWRNGGIQPEESR
jgi:hypothetical protein